MPTARDVLAAQDFWAGVVFMVIGAATIWAGADYEMGRAAQMGPGYVPRLLGLGLTGVGFVIAAKTFVPSALAANSPRIEPAAVLPIVLVVGGTVLFGLLIDRVGLVATVIAVTCVTAFAARERPHVAAVLLLGIGLALGSAALFVYGLKQAIPLWWWNL